MEEMNIFNYPLSKNELMNVLQTKVVDAGNGTLFDAAQYLNAASDRLTLVIGSGGCGLRAIKTAMRIADQKMGNRYGSFVKFIAVDSDTGELEPFSEMDRNVVKMLNISTPGARESLRNEHRSAFFRRIMPQDYELGLIHDSGASQDRMTGRIKLYDSYNGVGNDIRLKKMIQNIFNTDWLAHRGKPIDIILVTGISGGHGSGTFIDLAVIARNACPIQENVNVYGYLMLPDTMEHIAFNDVVKSSMYRNGFAALKELESYMSMIFEPERKEIFPCSNGEEIEVSYKNLPFDYPVLISGKYEDAVTMIGETIVNLITDNQTQFSQVTLYGGGNLFSMRNLALSKESVSNQGVLNWRECPEDSHMYCGIGYAHASVPEKIAIPNVIGKVCRKLYTNDNVLEEDEDVFCNYEKSLTAVQFEQAICTLFALEEIHPNALWEKIYRILESAGRVQENEIPVTKSDILSCNVQEYLEGFRVDETVLIARDRMIEELRRLQDEFIGNAQLVMKMYGPRAMQFLYEGRGNLTENGSYEDFSQISIRTLLANVQEGLKKLASTPGVYPQPLERKSFMEEVILSITKTDVFDWIGRATEAAQQDILRKVSSYLIGAGWQQGYENKILDFLSSCIRFADVMEIMMEHYESVGKGLDEGYERFSDETGENHGINLCHTQRMYNWVKENVERKIADIDLQTVKQMLINDFMRHREKWNSNEEGMARKRFDEIMSMSCGIGRYSNRNNDLKLSVSDYFDEMLNGEPDITAQTATIRNELGMIIAHLRQKSKIALNIEANRNTYVNVTFLVPQALIMGEYGHLINRTFNQLIGPNEQVYTSSVDAIVCYQTSVAIPISSLRDLTRWEIGYERRFTKTCHSCNGEYASAYKELTATETARERGEQCISPDIDTEYNVLAGTGLSWKHYPSINTRIYGDNFRNEKTADWEKTTESEYRGNVFDKKIEYALCEGIIECVNEGDKYTYFLNTIPEDWTKLDVSGYTEEQFAFQNGKYKRERELFEYLAKQNPHSQEKWRHQIKLQGSEFFEKPFDFTEIIDAEHWESERVNAVHKAYMKRIMRKNIFLYRNLQETLYRYYMIRRTLEEGEVQYKEQYQVNLFIDLFQYGLVYLEAKKSVWDDPLWNVSINEEGENKQIIVFNRKLISTLNDMEIGLYIDKLHFALVYCKVVQMAENGEIDLDELNALKDRFINNMPYAVLGQVKKTNLDRLNACYSVYNLKYANEKDEEKKMADAWRLKGGDRNGVRQISKLYWKIRQVLEEEGYEISESPVNDAPKPEVETWKCLICGRENDVDFLRCRKCGSYKRAPKTWICSICGRRHDAVLDICPYDRTMRPF